MALQTEMHVIALSELPALSDAKKASGARFVQMHCVCTDDGVFDAIYSWMEDDIVLKNYKIEGLTSKDVIPSVTNNFLAAFVFENEAHDLFGANIEGIAIDFQGHFYNIKATTPMSILSPEQKAARDKAAKVAAAKAAKEAAGQAAPAADASAENRYGRFGIGHTDSADTFAVVSNRNISACRLYDKLRIKPSV